MKTHTQTSILAALALSTCIGTVQANEPPGKYISKERRAFLNEVKELREEKRNAYRQHIKAIEQMNDIKVKLTDLEQCLGIWKQRFRHGYEAFGERYEGYEEAGKSKVTIYGHATGENGSEYPWTYVCALKDNLAIDRTRTYFSIRMDEQYRKLHPNSNGLFGNPLLPRI